MSDKVPVGVIGVGEYGSNHARQLKEVRAAELIGVYDLNLDRAQTIAEELGTRAFGSADELLDAVQAASVVIPTARHRETVSLAFERGVDVLVEKPIARTVENSSGGARRAVQPRRGGGQSRHSQPAVLRGSSARDLQLPQLGCGCGLRPHDSRPRLGALDDRRIAGRGPRRRAAGAFRQSGHRERSS